MSARCVYCGACASRGRHEACDADAEHLGRVVRAEFVAWSTERKAAGHDVPDPYLIPWNDLPAEIREVDRRIGMAVAREVWR